MRRKIITPTGAADIDAIFDYLAERTPSSAILYYNMALNIFEGFPDDLQLPAHAGGEWPEHIRVLHLGSPFRAYTLRIAIYDDAVYLLSAFRPGASDQRKDARTSRGLRDL